MPGNVKKGFNNYMCKKFFHPASRENLKRVWIAEQKALHERARQESLGAQYEREQELLSNRALLGDEKARLGLSFLYDAPPGLPKDRGGEGEEAEERQVKFEWQRRGQAPPRENFARDNADILDQPLGLEVRNVRCVRCRQWGHVSTDRVCPLFGRNLTAEPPQPRPLAALSSIGSKSAASSKTGTSSKSAASSKTGTSSKIAGSSSSSSSKSRVGSVQQQQQQGERTAGRGRSDSPRDGGAHDSQKRKKKKHKDEKKKKEKKHRSSHKENPHKEPSTHKDKTHKKSSTHKDKTSRHHKKHGSCHGKRRHSEVSSEEEADRCVWDRGDGGREEGEGEGGRPAGREAGEDRTRSACWGKTHRKRQAGLGGAGSQAVEREREVRDREGRWREKRRKRSHSL